MGKIKNIEPEDFSKASFDRLNEDEKITLLTGNYRVPSGRGKQKAFEMFQHDIRTTKTPVVRRLQVYLSAAASVAIIAIIVTIYFVMSPDQMIADRGEQSLFTFPDGSVVTLNADSRITYSKSTFVGKRELNLQGEAYFSVQKGSTFVVHTNSGKVEVLGTTFNVFARGQEFAVSCLTGKVRVHNSEQTAILLPGEKAELIAGELVKTVMSEFVEQPAWCIGKFRFDNMPLISTFEEIERQFDVSITMKGIENRFFTGSFTNNNLTEVLETVCLPMNLDYEINKGNKITVVARAK